MTPKLSPSDSKRLSILRFPLIVAVVFIHANNDRIGMLDPAGGPNLWVHWVRRFISEGLAAVAVPLFFLISGYLFFAGWKFTPSNFLQKLRGRVRTLLVPYLFWNVALALALTLASLIPQTRDLLSGKQGGFIHAGPWAWVSAIGGFTGPPVVYQFWFLRDLMIAILLVPVWSACHRFCPALWLTLLCVLWLTHTWPLPLPSIVSILFFYLGSYIAMSGRSLFALDAAWPWFLGAYSIVLLLEIVGGFAALHLLGILLGIVSALGFSSRLLASDWCSARLLTLSSSAFFLFAVHEPLLTTVQRLTTRVTGPTGALIDLVVYLVLPIFVIVFAWTLNLGLRRIFPRLTALVSGGR